MVSRRGRRARVAAVAAASAAALVAACAPVGAGPLATGGLRNSASWVRGAPVADDWLASGSTVGRGGPWQDMGEDALLDLERLTREDGATLAGPVGIWRYAWPRDAAFVAAAFAVTGHPDEAGDVLRFMQAAQAEDGSFEARYALDGLGPPDDRPPQVDGAGWLLWSAEVATRCPVGADELLEELRPLVERGTEHLLDVTGSGRRLPAPSPDYWEVRETRVPLGAVAPVLAGLQAGEQLWRRLGEDERARALGDAAARLGRAVEAHFGPQGYQRYASGGGHDAATAMMLPPFVAGADAGAVGRALERYETTALRPAGGLAPGAGWEQDGTSWTPEVALVALSSAHAGDLEGAGRWLTWLDEHRTSWGSLPEKVRHDGTLAGPAPLGWTAASVVLALAELDGTTGC